MKSIYCIALIIGILLIISISVLCSCKSSRQESESDEGEEALRSVGDIVMPSTQNIVDNDQVIGYSTFKDIENFFQVAEGFTSTVGDQLLTTNSSGNFVSVDPIKNTFYCDGSGSCTQPYAASKLLMGSWTIGSDTSGSLTFTKSGNSSGSMSILSSGLNLTQSSPAASASASTTNVLTFPDVGVYLLLVDAASGDGSNTIQYTDNCTRIWLAVVGPGTYSVYLYNLGNSSTSYYNVTSTSNKTINLVVNLGSFTYKFWYHKLF